VRLVDAWGRPFPCAGGYVQGRDGARYTIEVENRTDQRFEVVATVDGLDVLDGGPGDLGKRGYILGGGGTLRIDGFRRTLEEVAAFRFAVADSYAARKGDDTNVGVVGVAFFAERGAAGDGRRGRASPFPGSFAAPP
jgi:hypothetical protein